MEAPARARRRVVVMAMSPRRTRALMLQGADGRWDLPNSHLHWEVGARAREPLVTAATLLHDASLGILGEVTDMRGLLSSSAARSLLPAGGFLYSLPVAELEAATRAAARVRRHLHLQDTLPAVQLMPLAAVLQPRAHARFGGDTVEAAGLLALHTSAETAVPSSDSNSNSSSSGSGSSGEVMSK